MRRSRRGWIRWALNRGTLRADLACRLAGLGLAAARRDRSISCAPLRHRRAATVFRSGYRAQGQRAGIAVRRPTSRRSRGGLARRADAGTRARRPAGGAAAAGGMEFQHRAAAWLAVHREPSDETTAMLADRESGCLLKLRGRGSIAKPAGCSTSWRISGCRAWRTISQRPWRRSSARSSRRLPAPPTRGAWWPTLRLPVRVNGRRPHRAVGGALLGRVQSALPRARRLRACAP